MVVENGKDAALKGMASSMVGHRELTCSIYVQSNPNPRGISMVIEYLFLFVMN